MTKFIYKDLIAETSEHKSVHSVLKTRSDFKNDPEIQSELENNPHVK